MSRRATAASVFCLALAGCPSGVTLTQSLPYPCDPSLGDAQCPAGWRCGLEGSCHDRSVAADYLCHADGDCEQSWRCGLNGRCHARDVGAPLQCNTDNDCEQGWRCTCCGVGICHAPDVGSDYPCRSNDDCAADWHCGREGKCLSPDAGPSWPCVADLDCDDGWRCGLDGVCVDFRAEALQPGYEGPLDRERVSPLLPLEQVELASVALDSETAQGRRGYSLLVDGGLLYFLHTPDDANLVRAFSVALDGGQVRAMASLIWTTFLLDEAGFAAVDWADDGGGQLRRLGSAAGADRLKLQPVPGLVVGFGDGHVWRYDFNAGTRVEAFGPVGPDGGALHVLDADWNHDPFNSSDALVATTDQGMFRAVFIDGGFPLPFEPVYEPFTGGAPCGQPTDSGVPSWATWLEAKEGGPGDDQTYVTLGLMPALDAVGYSAIAVDEIWRHDAGQACVPLPAYHPACAACPSGEQAVELVNLWGDFDYGVNFGAFCQNAAGELHFDTTLVQPSGCLGPTVNGAVDRARTFRTHWGDVRLSAHGQLTNVWLGGDDGNVRLLTLPRPLPLERANGQLRASLSSTTDSNRFVPVPGVGLVMIANWVSPEPAVPDDIDQSEVSAVARTSDGGMWRVTDDQRWLNAAGLALVWRDDVIFAGPIDGDAGVALAFGVSPQPYSHIDALTAVAPSMRADGGLPFLAGYALAQHVLYFFERSAAGHWRTEPMLLPDDGDYFALWSDGPAGRLASRDGRVLALPSRLPLSQPLPGGATATEIRQACNVPFALTAQGLFRLRRATDGGLGFWESEDLSPLLPGAAVDPGFDWPAGNTQARLDQLGSDLFFTNAYGTIVRLAAPQSCP
jgi:hypothetical protein